MHMSNNSDLENLKNTLIWMRYNAAQQGAARSADLSEKNIAKIEDMIRELENDAKI